MIKVYEFLKNLSDVIFAFIYIIIVMLFICIGLYLFGYIAGAIVGGITGILASTAFMMWYAKDSLKLEE